MMPTLTQCAADPPHHTGHVRSQEARNQLVGQGHEEHPCCPALAPSGYLVPIALLLCCQCLLLQCGCELVNTNPAAWTPVDGPL
jgi:hypothetical protein